MTIKNYTPHTLDIQTALGIISLPSLGMARASESRSLTTTIDGVEIDAVEYGAVTGLPDYEPGTWLVVSSLTAAAVPQSRCDILVPGVAIRNHRGEIIGCKGLTVPAGRMWRTPEEEYAAAELAEARRAAAAAPEGHHVVWATSVYNGSHPERGYDDERYLLAVPEGDDTPSLSHLSNSRYVDPPTTQALVWWQGEWVSATTFAAA